MKKSNRNWLITVIVIVAAFLLWLLFKRNPRIAQTIQNNLPFTMPAILLPDTAPIDINVDIDGYHPRDYPLPAIPDYDDDGNGGTSCNFCLQSRVQIAPPSPPARIAPPQVRMPQPVRSFASVGGTSVSPSGVQHYSPTGIYLGKY